MASQQSILRARVVLLLLLCFQARAATYYVNSATGSDSNAGSAPTTAWKTLSAVNSYGWSPGFRPGDTILFSGTFASASGATTALYFQLDRSYGSTAAPITLASLSPSLPATIVALGATAILLYSVPTAQAGGLGFSFKNLILMGDGALDAKGKPTSGVSVWHDNPGMQAVSGLTLQGVTVSGFSSAGVSTYRSGKATPFIQNVQVLNTVAYNNPGYPGLTQPSGSGIVLSGVQDALIQGCTAYGNGGQNTNKAGPVGIWAYDADSVTIRNCTSHDNLSQGNDGGGFDLDGGTTNSIIEYCTSYNNYGYGYLFCAWSGYDTTNVTVRHSTSTNDAGGTKVSAAQVWPASGSTISQATFFNLTITLNPGTCTLWTNAYAYPSALGVYSGTANGAGSYANVLFSNNTVSCAGTPLASSNLLCSSSSSPNCGVVGGSLAPSPSPSPSPPPSPSPAPSNASVVTVSSIVMQVQRGTSTANCNAKVYLTWLNGTKVATTPKVSGNWSSIKPAQGWPYAAVPLATGCCTCSTNTSCGMAWFVSTSTLSATLNQGNGCGFTVTGVAGYALASGAVLTNSTTW